MLPAGAASSFDPFGDGNGDGRPDGLLGREHQALAARAIDQNASTSWSSLRYATANANGKGGVGLVIDLGASHQVEAVQLILGKLGAAVRVGVSQTLVSSPNAWPLLAKAPAGASHVSLRSPRPIAGRYVLLWFPRLPPSLTHPGTHQVRVSEVVVQGRG